LGLVGDPNRLRQILLNLVGNALKFTERGSVTLHVEPAPGATGCWLQFNVVDTGIGIAANKTAMIFERFTQADSSTTRKYGGTGLGLAISRSLATLMGGRIGCTSEEGKGSTFFVVAPFGIRDKVEDKAESAAFVEPAAAVQSPLKPPAREAPYRILIAEDSEYNLLLLKAYLDDSGFELDVAENGRLAVDKAISGNPDLILMDMQMPVMDGLEATRAIRQWEAGAKSRPIPILALTAHAADEALAKSMDAGCTEHLTKPIAKATLLEAISRHIGGKILVTPPKGIEKLVPRYLANVRREMDLILAGVDSKDTETVTRLGHQFKGSGNGYGFPEITRAGAAVESAAKNSDEAEIRSQILALSRYLDRVHVVV
jgi:CheY-like chemotaxis protein